MITLSESAKIKIREILSEESADTKLRCYVEGGGCSGMSYGFTLETQLSEDDLEFQFDDITVIVDSVSMQYLHESQIDYRDDLIGSSFVVNNPNAETTCGCGSSFSVGDDFMPDYSWQ